MTVSQIKTPNANARLQNMAASLLLITAFILLYATIPYYQNYFSASTLFAGTAYRHRDILWWAASIYAGILTIYYATESAPRTAKSIACLCALKRFALAPRRTWQQGFPAHEKLGLLSTLLKGFFAPLMVVWLFDHTLVLLDLGRVLLETRNTPGATLELLKTSHGYWFFFKLIVFADVFFFTLGYLIELPALKNEIRSVDSTWLGWVMALLCYPPFNGITGSVFGWHSSDFPQFIDHPTIHIVANLAFLGLMALYAWSSIALNFKASNLTHRGIVANGPYRWVRHPAYLFKNLAWWIGIGPALLAASRISPLETLLVIGSMAGWSCIYAMRALTEEQHLRQVDGEYEAYCKKVRYRFIPGVV
jgi:protein-S-isoprenylcysteine O-methyltransferase Ste14